MPIFEYKTTITAKKKKRKRTKWKKSRPTHATTLYSTTCLQHYYEMLANFFRQFLAISFLPVDINDFLDFFPKPQDFWVLLYLEPSYKMPSCNVWKRITKTVIVQRCEILRIHWFTFSYCIVIIEVIIIHDDTILLQTLLLLT